MKNKVGISGLVFISTLITNVSGVFAYNGNTNVSGGIVLLFIPVMLSIIYLASKNEMK